MTQFILNNNTIILNFLHVLCCKILFATTNRHTEHREINERFAASVQRMNYESSGEAHQRSKHGRAHPNTFKHAEHKPKIEKLRDATTENSIKNRSVSSLVENSASQKTMPASMSSSISAITTKTDISDRHQRDLRRVVRGAKSNPNKSIGLWMF
jgi:hypothetical protein